MKKFFSKFACMAAGLLGNAYAFLAALCGVIFWAITGPAFGFSETWQLVINTSTTIITFLSVFLIQNSQNRESKAMQLKLDELILTLKEAHNDMIDAENLSDEELEKIGQHFKKYCKGGSAVPCAEADEKPHRNASREENNPTAIEDHSLEWMPKAVWGPIKWQELHCRALARLPMDEEKDWFGEFLKGLPCPECREHFDAFLKKQPPTFESREKFFEWTIAAHNYVNRALDKKELLVEEALRLYKDKYKDDPNPEPIEAAKE